MSDFAKLMIACHLTIFASAAVAQVPPPPKPALNKSTQIRLDNLIREIKEGRLGAIHQIAQPLVESLQAHEVEQADDYLRQHGVNDPLAKLIVSARLQLAMEGAGTRIRRPGEKELPLALEHLSQKSEELLEPVLKEINTGLPAVIPHEVIDRRLDLLPSLILQVDQVEKVYEHLIHMLRRARPNQLQQLGPQAQLAATHDWNAEIKGLSPYRDQLTERLVDLCVVQVRDMVIVLGNKGISYKDRLLAAQRIGKSLSVVDTYWRAYQRRQFRGPGASNPNKVYKELVAYQRSYERLAGELEQKAFLLEEGVRWWLRGRFGQGPLNGGLAKAMPYAVRNSEHLLLYYPLRMPNPIPHPPDPLKNPLKIPVPRRHIDYWSAESGLPTLAPWPPDFTLSQPEEVTPRESFSAKELRALRSRLNFNLASVGYVGYLEYQMALFYFEKLLSSCNVAEIRAINEMIAEDNRLVVHSNLSRQYNPFAKDSTLHFPFSKTTDPRAKGEYERRGLDWMMALARIELGAMVAARIPHMRVPVVAARKMETTLPPETLQINGFRRVFEGPTDRNIEFFTQAGRDPKLEPFALWPPTSFEQDAFVELLWDAARHHYYSMRTEFLFVQQRNNFINLPELDKILVRFAVASEFVETATQVTRPRLTDAQYREISFWQSWIENNRSLVEESIVPTVNVRRF